MREKTILLMVIAGMLTLCVFFLRYAVRTEGTRGALIFKMFTIILLAIVAVCVYTFVKS